MSAPNTDPEKQAKKHKGPLSGMTGVVIFALVLLAGLAIYMTMRGNEPGNEQAIEADQVGATEEADPGTAGQGETGAAPDGATGAVSEDD